MSRFDFLKAWKNAPTASKVGNSPVGAIELSDAEAATVDGKLAIAVCSGCHGCTRVPTFGALARINPAPLLKSF
jgi:hypothetical protein